MVTDFGAQYAHLISRRIREYGVRSELIPYDITPDEIRKMNPDGIIFSGGPASIYAADAPRSDPEILSLNIPVLGICYGLQLMIHQEGGRVSPTESREYGHAELVVDDESDLLKGIQRKTSVWMSHGDIVESLPDNFEVIAHTRNTPYAAIKDSGGMLYAVQFHPEVVHTPEGGKILSNFLYEICRCDSTWSMDAFVEGSIKKIKEKVGNEKVMCAVSGGIDSTTTATLVSNAIGENLMCVFVNHGLLRKGESQDVVNMFRKELGVKLVYIDASERFIRKLKGISDPELKRKIIGEEFIAVFTDECKKLGDFRWLAQGTLYPDVIESSGTGSPASRIKTHHNVGGLPDQMTLKLLEPLRDLYKDEVRIVAGLLGIPTRIINRHPFPGPGLGVRIIGEATSEKIQICRDASAIVEEELIESKLYSQVWQAFAVVGDDKAVGIFGDKRNYGYVVTIKIVQSVDAMTADWYRIPHRCLAKMSDRITNEVRGVTLVTYAVSSKPPSTIEPQ